MATKQNNKHKCIWVKWCDATSQKGSFCKGEDFAREMIIESCGILIKSDEQGVLMAQDYSTHDDVYRDSLSIPRDYIIKKKIL